MSQLVTLGNTAPVDKEYNYYITTYAYQREFWILFSKMERNRRDCKTFSVMFFLQNSIHATQVPGIVITYDGFANSSAGIWPACLDDISWYAFATQVIRLMTSYSVCDMYSTHAIGWRCGPVKWRRCQTVPARLARPSIRDNVSVYQWTRGKWAFITCPQNSCRMIYRSKSPNLAPDSQDDLHHLHTCLQAAFEEFQRFGPRYCRPLFYKQQNTTVHKLVRVNCFFVYVFHLWFVKFQAGQVRRELLRISSGNLALDAANSRLTRGVHQVNWTMYFHKSRKLAVKLHSHIIAISEVHCTACHVAVHPTPPPMWSRCWTRYHF